MFSYLKKQLEKCNGYLAKIQMVNNHEITHTGMDSQIKFCMLIWWDHSQKIQKGTS